MGSPSLRYLRVAVMQGRGQDDDRSEVSEVTERYASIEAAAAHFGVAEDFVYSVAQEMNGAGRCAFKAGNKWRINLADMEDFLGQRTRDQQAGRVARRRAMSDRSSTNTVAARIDKSW